MYKIVGKDNDICSVYDSSDEIVEDISVSDLVSLFRQGVFVEGFDYDLKTARFSFDIDNSLYKIESIDRVEQHQITRKNPYYNMLLDYCRLSKNLYNHANYLHRQDYFDGKDYRNYMDIYKQLKDDIDYPDFSNMPTCHIANQVLRKLDKNWKSYFASIKDYYNNPSKYLGKPKPPKYLDKNGYFELDIPLENIKTYITDGKLSFNKHFNGFQVDTRCYLKKGFEKVTLVRIIPRKGYLVIEVCYRQSKVVRDINRQPQRVVGIDLGVDNLAAIASSTGVETVIVNGRGLKSINQYYNKKLSKLQSSGASSKISRLTRRRNNKVNDYMHKASRYIINYCTSNNIDTIVIGYNKGWKQGVELGKKSNQKFVSIPFLAFKRMLEYKAHDSGIQVIETEESYTSKTSYLDNEMPYKQSFYKGRRITRGLFKSSKGILINADINGAYQIMRKKFPQLVPVQEVKAVKVVNVS